MGQVKKDAVRDAVLASASRLFEKKGYTATTMKQIAARANTVPSNVYVYFESKLQIAFAIYQPWLESEIHRLEDDVMKVTQPEQRLRMIISRLWCEIPRMRNGFARSFIQAVSTASPQEYSPSLLQFLERRIAALILTCLPPERRAPGEWESVAKILLMAFDGFVINNNLNPMRDSEEAVVNAAVRLLTGSRS